MIELAIRFHKTLWEKGDNAGNKHYSPLIVFSKGFLDLNPFPKNTWFLCVCSTSLLKTLREKGKLLLTSNFSFSHSVFYLSGELPAVFIKLEIVVCELQV